jgi:RNA polymerase sigma factor (sigma-70 family)
LVTDNELIGRYLFADDAAAFEELMRRHSGLVMGVCRGMLLQTQDAEDAFQATFLVLSRKAKSLIDHGSIAGWLYQAAMRNCLQVRRRKSRMRETEMKVEPCRVDEPWQAIASAQENDLVSQEINRLPVRYRDAIVLCHLKGHSRAEAAELLDWTEQAVKAALSRGRNLLRKRLIRSGLITSTLLVSLSAATSSGQEYVSDSLIISSLEHCQGLTPTAQVGTSSQFVHSLANHGVMSMQASTLIKSVSIAAALFAGVMIPLGVIAQQTGVHSTSEKSDYVIAEVQTDAANDDKVPESIIATIKQTSASQNLDGGSATTIRPHENGTTRLAPRSSLGAKRLTGLNEFAVEDSLQYWELIRKSAEIRSKSLTSRAKNEGDTDAMADAYEQQAKILEAEINMKRIQHLKNNPQPERSSNTSLPGVAGRINPPRKDGVTQQTIEIEQPTPRADPILLKEELESMRKRLGESHPSIKKLEQQIEELESALALASRGRSPIATSAIPPASTTPVQPGETLLVESMTDPSLNRRVVVRADHTISLPLAGTLSVKAKTVDQIQESLEVKFSAFVKEPMIFVARESASTPLEK